MNQYTQPVSTLETIAALLGAALLAFLIEGYGIWLMLAVFALAFIIIPLWKLARWLLDPDELFK